MVVDYLCLGIFRGECFGLLGINGIKLLMINDIYLIIGF